MLVCRSLTHEWRTDIYRWTGLSVCIVLMQSVVLCFVYWASD